MSPQIPQIELAGLPADLLESTTLLDVREDDEWQAGHVDGAVHVPMNELPNRLGYAPETLPEGRPILVVCRSGGRSAQVTAWLHQHGYDATNLVGGMSAWAAAGRPIVSSDGSEPHIV